MGGFYGKRLGAERVRQGSPEHVNVVDNAAI